MADRRVSNFGTRRPIPPDRSDFYPQRGGMTSNGGKGDDLNGFAGFFCAEGEMIRARCYMREKIYAVLLQRERQHPPLNDHEMRKLEDVVKRLEEALLRHSTTKEDYMNLETLESRLHGLIRRPQMNSQNQKERSSGFEQDG